MFFRLFYVAIAASFTRLSSALLDKPIIQPNFPGGGLRSLGQGLLDHLTPTASNWDHWGAGWIPQDCKTIAEGSGFSALDITTFNIHYEDCGDVWIFCRHKNSPLSEVDAIDLFGRLPVRMRSFIRHIIFLPGANSAGSSGDNIQMNGKIDITVFAHEIGHSLDSHAFNLSYGIPFSTSSIWIDNYNLDSAVADSYAQTSQQENFAQETAVSLYYKVVPGGIGVIQPNWQAIFYQYATLQGYIGDVIIPGGRCSSRLGNSAPVLQVNSAKANLILSDQPDVTLSWNVTEIEHVPMSSTFELTEFDKAGRAVGRKTVWLNV